MNKKYDYIFIGAGCAALSLLVRMIDTGLTTGKNILLIDRAPKQKNDRTWCFWENKPGFFEPVVCKQWNQLWFYSDRFAKKFDISPYRYKMIRGIDFYNYCFNRIQHAGIDILYGEITGLCFSDNSIRLQINDQLYAFAGATVFNSIYSETAVRRQKPVYLLQHFKGWMVETAQPFFNTEEATLMDFRTPQTNGTTFIYVLPLSATRALVEYTLFSETILPGHLYDEGLAQYLHQRLQLKAYTITEQEFGVIPMTNAKFPWYTDGMYHIGTAGGQTKASSGYTFQFIQKQSAAIIQHLQKDSLSPQIKPGAAAKRFDFYDAVLLRVLAQKYAPGSQVFTSLFKKNRPGAIFRFLDNESTRATDLKIISSLPAMPFLKAACKQITGK